jgi:hypothetical protein
MSHEGKTVWHFLFPIFSFEVLTEVTMKITVICNVMLRSLIHIYQHFAEISVWALENMVNIYQTV